MKVLIKPVINFPTLPHKLRETYKTLIIICLYGVVSLKQPSRAVGKCWKVWDAVGKVEVFPQTPRKNGVFPTVSHSKKQLTYCLSVDYDFVGLWERFHHPLEKNILFSKNRRKNNSHAMPFYETKSMSVIGIVEMAWRANR